MQPNINELKEMYKDSECQQCSPCIDSFIECGGSLELAKEWKCPRFVNGVLICKIRGNV
jgi:hypothetical protein